MVQAVHHLGTCFILWHICFVLQCFCATYYCQPADRVTFVAYTLLCCSIEDHTCHWEYVLLYDCAVGIVSEHVSAALEPLCDMLFSCRR